MNTNSNTFPGIAIALFRFGNFIAKKLLTSISLLKGEFRFDKASKLSRLKF